MQMLNKIVNIVLVCVLGYLVFTCMRGDNQSKIPLPYEYAKEDTMNKNEEDTEDEDDEEENDEDDEEDEDEEVSGTYDISSSPLDLTDEKGGRINLQNSCGEKNVPFLSSHLLPKKEDNDENFSEFAPNKDDISSENFLESDRFTMTSQSKRNSNLSLRSEPPNPKNMVCPWMQSTIEPDEYRKPLEIGN